MAGELQSTKFFCFFLFTKRRFFLRFNLLLIAPVRAPTVRRRPQDHPR